MQDRMPANQVSNSRRERFRNSQFLFFAGKSGFRAKKLSKLGEILSVLDEKNTSKRAAPRGIDWTPLFGAENE